jgi:glycyl-tRNA synthetase (class II)
MGWTECVGCMDRAACDLSVHSENMGHALVVRQVLAIPMEEGRLVAEWNGKVLGKTFAAGAVKVVEGMDEVQLEDLKGKLTEGYVNQSARLLVLFYLNLTSSHRPVILHVEAYGESDPKRKEYTEMLAIERKTFKRSSKSNHHFWWVWRKNATQV